MTEWQVARTLDFDVTSSETQRMWEKAHCYTLSRLWDGTLTYRTEARLLYSVRGLYFRFDCEDRKLTATFERDNEDLFKEDVIEVFIWPDERHRIYFEYEISPLGKELPLLIPNPRGTFMGWLPWHYEGERLIKRNVIIHGGVGRPGAAITGWTASFFIPYALLTGLMCEEPTAGSRWRANLYRIDYDDGSPNHWAGAPLTGRTFHAPEQFGTMVFA
jgi:hypothetical protein